MLVLAAGYARSVEQASALQDFVRGRLADYKRPRWVGSWPSPQDGDGQDTALQVAQLA